MHRRPHRGPRVTVAEGHIGGQRHRYTRVEQRRHPPELTVLGGGDVIKVLITALHNEIGLGHHGHPEVGQIGQTIRRNHRGVLDAIARPRAGVAQRRDGDQQLSGGDAVDGHRVGVAMPAGDPAD
jgi:hypothetical protein